jgi:3-isopropylmalate/(R)-2-methylmalate dehydratase large subunit
MAGAFGEFASGIGNTDAGFILGTGKLLVKVPETMRFYLEGELPAGLMAKDVILHIIGDIGFDGATYRAMQWEGPGARAMSIDDRMTIANMAIEAGAKNGIFPADEKTFAYVDERARANGTKSEYQPVELDREQKLIFDKVYDLSKLEPTVAMHPNPGNRALAKDLEYVKLDRAYIGSCTGGKTSDFVAFAEVVQGRKVAIDTYGVPATSEVVQELKDTLRGGSSVWDTLLNAGVTMTENASCAACLGGPVDTFGRLNAPLTCISATNRNFPGRMGSKESKVYLASPYTVAASALTGRITDPREFLS